MSVTAIVLAGGRSSRFGGDKLAAPIDGRSVLALTVDAIASLADEIYVAGPRLPEDLSGVGPSPRLVPDAEPFEGPLLALAGALEAAAAREAAAATREPARGAIRLGAPGPVALVVGGDMPRLVPAVLVAMLEILDTDPSVDAVLLGRPSGLAVGPADVDRPPPRRAVLPLAVRLAAADDAARTVVSAGGRSLQALVDRLVHVELAPATWLPLDPEAFTLTDVDTASELARARTPDVR